MVYLLVVVAAVLIIAAIAYFTQRKSRDGVASFKRQIDALSPEARKPVVEQVQSVSDLRRSKSRKPGPTVEPAPIETAPVEPAPVEPANDGIPPDVAADMAHDAGADGAPTVPDATPADSSDDPEDPAHGA